MLALSEVDYSSKFKEKIAVSASRALLDIMFRNCVQSLFRVTPGQAQQSRATKRAVRYS